MLPAVIRLTRPIPAGGMVTVTGTGPPFPVPVVWDPCSWYRRSDR